MEAPANSVMPTKTGSEYAELMARVRRAGLLERTIGHSAMRIGVTAGLFAGGWTAFALLGSSWWQLIVAAFLAVAFTQCGFLGHEAGHRQVFRSNRANDIVGLISGNLGIGLSFGWWVHKHNRHHANPNHEGKDPDIAPGAVVFTQNDAARLTGIAKLWTRSQAYLFFPLLFLEALALRVASIQAIMRREVKRGLLEMALFFTHIAVYFTVVFMVLSPGQALAFIAVHQGLLGFYLGCSFAPNHKGMALLSENEKMDFLRRQVLTSRNVKGGPVIDFVLGGLNYQIEHHLFPSMPRKNLRRAQPLVREFCTERGVPYLESTLFSSYAQTLRHLHSVSRQRDAESAV
jgi:fatty acid desaturase